MTSKSTRSLLAQRSEPTPAGAMRRPDTASDGCSRVPSRKTGWKAWCAPESNIRDAILSVSDAFGKRVGGRSGLASAAWGSSECGGSVGVARFRWSHAGTRWHAESHAVERSCTPVGSGADDDSVSVRSPWEFWRRPRSVSRPCTVQLPKEHARPARLRNFPGIGRGAGRVSDGRPGRTDGYRPL